MFAGAEQAGEILELALGFGGGQPGAGILGLAELCDHEGIDLVVFIAGQHGTSVMLDLAGINTADFVLGLEKELGQSFPIMSSGFHAGMELEDSGFSEPLAKIFEACGVIGKRLALLGGIVREQSAIELVFGDINAENSFVHNECFGFV